MVFLFLGFPSFFTKSLAIITGLIIVIFAYRIRFKENSFTGGSSFTDNKSRETSDSSQPTLTPTQTASTDYSNTTSTTDVA